MSISVMTKIWDVSNQEGSALLALLCLADHANDDGICWPSIARIAHRIRLEERQARRILRHLESAGELYTPRVSGRGRTPHYMVTTGLNAATIERVLTQYYEMPKPDAAKLAAALVAAQVARKGVVGAPISPQEKGSSGAEMGSSGTEKGSSRALKGVIAKAPESLEPSVLEPSESGEDGAIALWDRIKTQINGTLTKATFDSIIRPAQAVALDGDLLIVEVSPNAKEWLEGQLSKVISRASCSVGATVVFRVKGAAQ